MGMRRARDLAAALLVLASAFPSYRLLAGGVPEAVASPPASDGPAPRLPDGVDRALIFETDVKPVLDRRCVVCHACYDAPCQLLLSSQDGASRGATKKPVYDASRLLTMRPTRLSIDAHGTKAWRSKGFFSVLGDERSSAEPSDSDAVLSRMLSLGRTHPFAPNEKLPAAVALGIDRTLSCATRDEFDDYAREHPLGGMPYGMAPLRPDEHAVLAAWARRGAAAPPAPSLAPGASAQVKTWEGFLNGASLREQIVARYLYEHWFVAHLYFDDSPAGPFFRVVRSRTAPGRPIDVVPTVRPYDDPGGPFWYRLQPIDSTIVHKTHIVYALGPDRLVRLRELFLGSGWQPTRLPGYSPERASNPFVSFDQIPARSRYRFLLDDARYFVMTFIRGPVCRGQVAVDVIEDHFFVSFLDPAHDLSVTNPEFLARTKTLLDLPAEHRGLFLPGQLWVEYELKQREYLEARESFYQAADLEHRGPALDWIWDGEGSNRNAQLTVMRNYDNAEVVEGFVGGMPKTAWVMDFPIFERIYYNLVAGYDVFGDLEHQVATRLYMDHLRMQSENLFLKFLPANRREQIRASWYVGATRQLDYFLVDRLRGLGDGTQIQFTGPDVEPELLGQILERSPAVSGPPDTINRCARAPCDREGATATERAVERQLQRIASIRGPWVERLPEVTLLRVRVDPAVGRDLVYSLVHNDARTNVAFMFDEKERRLPADDTVTVIRGHFGSYPNFFMEAAAGEIEEFVDALLALASGADFERFTDRYGIRRTDARFWDTSDWLREDLLRRSPTEAGVYDFGRYGNP